MNILLEGLWVLYQIVRSPAVYITLPPVAHVKLISSAPCERCAEVLHVSSYQHFLSVYLPEENESFLGEDDGSGNSCTIGSEVYLDVSYLHYLYDARMSISSCIRACRVWSALYDGEDPPPEKYQPGVLEEPGLKSRQTQMALRKVPQLIAPRPRPIPPQNTEPASNTQMELEWDDSYDACPVQTHEPPVESKPAQEPPAELPQHIQEMRKTATMLVKGSYIEENEFEDDVLVYDLVAKKDTREVEQIKPKRIGSESEERQPGSAEAPLKNGLSVTLPASGMSDMNNLDPKAKGQTDCNSHPQNTTSAEPRDDLLAQYEELIRTLDTEAARKQVKPDAQLKKPTTAAEEEEEEEMDFTSFSAETPEKVHSPFGVQLGGGGAGRNQSAPFTGKWNVRLAAVLLFTNHWDSTNKMLFMIILPAGPFVSVLLSRLENMLSNSLHVNLLLTGILAQLATYPQPLLRSFLLNTNLVFQPTVRSLYQVKHIHCMQVQAGAFYLIFLPLRLVCRHLDKGKKNKWIDLCFVATLKDVETCSQPSVSESYSRL